MNVCLVHDDGVIPCETHASGGRKRKDLSQSLWRQRLDGWICAAQRNELNISAEPSVKAGGCEWPQQPNAGRPDQEPSQRGSVTPYSALSAA